MKAKSVRMTLGTLMLFILVGEVRAQEAEIVTQIGKDMVEALGERVPEYGGKEAVEQTAERLVVQAGESAGSAGGQIAKAQIERIVATGRQTLLFDLKQISGRSLPLLADVGDQMLPGAVVALARPEVDAGIESLESTALKQAALVGESRLPGVGLQVVKDFGEAGAELLPKLSEDQANSILIGMHPTQIEDLSPVERSGLFDALASRPTAKVVNFQKLSGPLIVVAAGAVIWHGETLLLSPDEHVITRPDGTVERTTTGAASQLAGSAPAVAREMANPLKWTGVIMAIGVSFVAGFFIWCRERRIRSKLSR